MARGAAVHRLALREIERTGPGLHAPQRPGPDGRAAGGQAARHPSLQPQYAGRRGRRAGEIPGRRWEDRRILRAGRSASTGRGPAAGEQRIGRGAFQLHPAGRRSFAAGHAAGGQAGFMEHRGMPADCGPQQRGGGVVRQRRQTHRRGGRRRLGQLRGDDARHAGRRSRRQAAAADGHGRRDGAGPVAGGGAGKPRAGIDGRGSQGPVRGPAACDAGGRASRRAPPSRPPWTAGSAPWNWLRRASPSRRWTSPSRSINRRSEVGVCWSSRRAANTGPSGATAPSAWRAWTGTPRSSSWPTTASPPSCPTCSGAARRSTTAPSCPCPLVKEKGDQIALCLAACRKYGVQCHVWKVNWNMREAPENSPRG